MDTDDEQKAHVGVILDKLEPVMEELKKLRRNVKASLADRPSQDAGQDADDVGLETPLPLPPPA